LKRRQALARIAAGTVDTGHEGGSGSFALEANGRQNWMGIIDNAYLSYGAVLGTDDSHLSRFRDRGGKIIILHGLADQLIPAAGMIDYYKRVQQRMSGE
jgi:hypothetical protein